MKSYTVKTERISRTVWAWRVNHGKTCVGAGYCQTEADARNDAAIFLSSLIA